MQNKTFSSTAPPFLQTQHEVFIISCRRETFRCDSATRCSTTTPPSHEVLCLCVLCLFVCLSVCVCCVCCVFVRVCVVVRGVFGVCVFLCCVFAHAHRSRCKTSSLGVSLSLSLSLQPTDKLESYGDETWCSEAFAA